MPLIPDLAGLLPVLATGAATALRPLRERPQAPEQLDVPSELETIQALSWRQCFVLLSAAFGHRGYEVRPAPVSHGGGVDLVLRRAGRQILVHCRHWNVWTVREEPVRELAEAVRREGADGGVVLTCGRFAESADRAAREQDIELIDGPGLVELLSEAA